MLSVVKFKYKEELTSTDLNTLDDNIVDAIRDLGMLGAETFEDWVIQQDNRLSLDRVYLTDEDYTAGARYVDFTNPSRSSLVTPSFPPHSGWWGGNIWGDNNGEDYIYFAFNRKFEGLNFDFDYFAAGDISGSWTWEYWKGGSTNAWTSIVGLTDTTTGFTTDGTVYWTPSNQTDWEAVSLNTANGIYHAENEDRFWVRMKGGHNNIQSIRIAKVVRYYHLASPPTPRRDELQVIPTDPASMAVGIRPGVAYIDGYLVILPYETYVSIKVPSSNNWYAAVQITKDGEIIVDYSTPDVSPTQKNSRVDAIKLADILVNSTDTSIVSGDITDQRIAT